MAIGHEKTGEDLIEILGPEGPFVLVIACNCGESIQGDLRPTEEAAMVSGSTAWNLHLQGA